MSEFGDMEKKAESFAKEHPQDVDKGVGEAEKVAEHETGDKYDSEIQRAANAAEQHVGGDGQGQNQGGGGQAGQG